MADEHAHRIAQTVVGQVADVCGYSRVQRHALDLVADILMRYIQEIALYARENTEQARQTDVNARDVVRECGLLCLTAGLVLVFAGGAVPCWCGCCLLHARVLDCEPAEHGVLAARRCHTT